MQKETGYEVMTREVHRGLYVVSKCYSFGGCRDPKLCRYVYNTAEAEQ